MSIESEITVGTIAIVKVGRNEVEVTVTEITEHGWKVKSRTGREFEVRKIERVLNEQPAEETAPAEPAVTEETPETEAAPVKPEAEEEDNTPNPAPESGRPENPERKLSLLNAAAKVLETCRVPMNTKELVAKAIEMNLWVPTGAKTPEQTLYSGIFREMKTSEESRFKKSETKKGFFEYAK